MPPPRYKSHSNSLRLLADQRCYSPGVHVYIWAGVLVQAVAYEAGDCSQHRAPFAARMPVGQSAMNHQLAQRGQVGDAAGAGIVILRCGPTVPSKLLFARCGVNYRNSYPDMCWGQDVVRNTQKSHRM